MDNRDLTKEEVQNIKDLVRGADQPTKKMDALFNFFEEVLPKIEEYREKNVGKYYAEQNTEYGGEYFKMEKYKNRVRVVDIFLAPLKDMLRSAGVLPHSNERDSQIP